MKKILLIFISLCVITCSKNTKSSNFNSTGYLYVSSAEQISERFVVYLNSYSNISDSLFIYLCEYCNEGYHYEGDLESIAQRLHEMFYKNDTIGDYFDNYLERNGIDVKVQDTIRIRTMTFILGHHNVVDNIPLSLDSTNNYPYFNMHNSILDIDSAYLYYF